ncbi:MAG: 4-hydroxy-tetrahydrodipicolinate reductase [Clostridia bacterium]|nr:4-hydroxy-tetrahydrodipicolinate reductase [Clostridia bacterium]
MVNILMHGCNGRMGKSISQMCKGSDKYRIVAGVDMFSADNGFGYPIFESLAEVDVDFDVIIDFSNANIVPTVAQYAMQNKKPLICCTTGLSDDTCAMLLEASKIVPVFKSANMSLGMNVLFELVRSATKVLYPDYEMEIVEAHHNKKLDAPSGTAYMIADVISEETNNEVEYVFDRHDVRKARDHKELGISSIRGGNIVGNHDVMFIGDEEILTISHQAQDRSVFGRGALRAAEFVVGKEPGMYTMQDITAQILADK